MNITFDLCRHCIETEAKRLYNRFVSQYFKSQTGRQEIEKKIEILKFFLEKADFARIRNTFPELSGNCDADITLTVNKENQIIITINGKEINIF